MCYSNGGYITEKERWNWRTCRTSEAAEKLCKTSGCYIPSNYQYNITIILSYVKSWHGYWCAWVCIFELKMLVDSVVCNFVQRWRYVVIKNNAWRRVLYSYCKHGSVQLEHLHYVSVEKALMNEVWLSIWWRVNWWQMISKVGIELVKWSGSEINSGKDSWRCHWITTTVTDCSIRVYWVKNEWKPCTTSNIIRASCEFVLWVALFESSGGLNLNFSV